MKLSENFFLNEFVHSNYATRNGIDNIPPVDVIKNLIITAQGMEQVRKIMGAPIFISSGYRSPELNKKIGGSKTSAHCEGFAADFLCERFGTSKEIVRVIKNSGLHYDQLIDEHGWTHIAFSPAMRQQTLTATFYKGKASYSQFT